MRRNTSHPFVLDENIDSLDMLLRGKADLAMDVVNLKISKLGGLTKTRQARDLCVSMGIAMTLEDSWGGDITTAAIAHLAHSTPEEFRFTSTDFNSYVTVSTADRGPAAPAGFHGGEQRSGTGRSRHEWTSSANESWRSREHGTRVVSGSQPTVLKNRRLAPCRSQMPRRSEQCLLSHQRISTAIETTMKRVSAFMTSWLVIANSFVAAGDPALPGNHPLTQSQVGTC